MYSWEPDLGIKREQAWDLLSPVHGLMGSALWHKHPIFIPNAVGVEWGGAVEKEGVATP